MSTTAAISEAPLMGVVGGQVTDPRGFGLAGAHVDIADETTAHTIGTVTGGDGRFLIAGLALGHRFTLIVRCIGFAPWTGTSSPVVPAVAEQPGAPSTTVSLVPLADGYVGLAR